MGGPSSELNKIDENWVVEPRGDTERSNFEPEVMKGGNDREGVMSEKELKAVYMDVDLFRAMPYHEEKN